MNIYKIATKDENGKKLYFNNDYYFFGENFGTEYKSRKSAENGLCMAKKYAPTNDILLNLNIEKQ